MIERKNYLKVNEHLIYLKEVMQLSYVTEEEVRKLISIRTSPDDLALLRDQAAAAFLFLSGMRGTAFVTLPIGAFDMDKLTVCQWPELGVKTKNGMPSFDLLYLTLLLGTLRSNNPGVSRSYPAIHLVKTG